MQTARRIAAIPPYLFAEIDRRIAEKRATGVDVISFGIGDPDLPTPEFIVEELARAAHDPSTHQYPSYFGLPEFREAIADFYQRRFGVALDPTTQVLPLIGSKEGIAHLPWAFVDPGDPALVTEPGYPVYEVGTILAGGEPVHLPLSAEQGWFPDFGRRPGQDSLAQLPVQPDRRGGDPGPVRGGGALRRRPRAAPRPRQRLLGDHLRRLRGSVGP
jgi:LL-diaminopimelate aminotransferase